MTAQPIETDTLIDIAAMVGEMDAVPCEHVLHNEPASGHHGPATHYVQKQCRGCEKAPTVYPACRGFIDMLAAYKEWECPKCDSFGPASEFIAVLGPVTK